MTTIAINVPIEFIVLPVVALIFGLAIYFFLKSRKTLRETLEAARLQQFNAPRRNVMPKLSYNETAAPPAPAKRSIIQKEVVLPLKKHTTGDEHMVTDLKQTIEHQQKLLNNYLDTIEELENKGKEELKHANNQLQDEIVKLHDLIEQKDAEYEELYRQTAAAKKMAARIEEVYNEFESLQSKMQALEKQAARSNSLAIELEDARNAYEVVHKELARKQDKLEEVMEDNRSMKDELNMLEDKLSEANLQRQQLQKKVQFLTDLNNDMQNLSENNKKLQTELRRIGELESMLTMIAEERDHLLRRKMEK